MMRRLVGLVLAGALALAGCGSAGEGPRAPSGQVQTLRFCVDSALGGRALEQAQLFAQQAGEISGGTLLVEVAAGEPGTGEWELAFLDCAQLSQADPVFSLFSMPFLYDNVEHLDRALNSQQLLEALSQRLEGVGLRPLAAFGRGGPHLATAGLELRTPGDFQGVTLALGEGQPQRAAAFQALGARAVEAPAGHTAGLLGQELEDAGRVEAAEAALEEAQALAEAAGELTLVNSCHAIEPLWLVAQQGSWDQLTQLQQAALLEALAGLSGRMELGAQEWEQSRRAALEQAGAILVEVERPLLAQAVYEGNANYQLPDFFDRQLYDWIQEYA